jgi:LPXTG-site transpeptidase (sortase) family protein
MTTRRSKQAKKIITIVLLVFFLSISAVLLFSQLIKQNAIYGKTAGLESNEENTSIEYLTNKQGFPVHMKIPSIGVDADIQHVGLNSEGEMDVPDSTDRLGWFAFGPRPGEKGSSVIAGHLYGEDGKPGVFANLSKVKQGDKVHIEDSKGNTITFIVKRQSLFDPGFVFNVFNRTEYPYLNLVTCDGDWDITKESYTKRLVVFTEVEN